MRLRSVFVVRARLARLAAGQANQEFLWKSRKTLKIRGKRLILQHFPEFLKHLDGVVAHANQCNGRLELALTSQNQEGNAFLDSIRAFDEIIFQIFDENIFWYRKFPDFTDL